MYNKTATRRATWHLFVFALLAAALAWGAGTAAARQSAPAPSTPAPTPEAQSDAPAQDEAGDSAAEAAGAVSSVEPKLKDYRGVTIGMAAAEARRKLGNEDAQGKTSDFFRVSDGEMTQLFYDADGRVRAVSVIYTGGAPPAKDVLGEDAEPGSDGRVHKLIRYPRAGYWVAYSRSAGDAPVVTVTIQKMRAPATASQ